MSQSTLWLCCARILCLECNLWLLFCKLFSITPSRPRPLRAGLRSRGSSCSNPESLSLSSASVLPSNGLFPLSDLDWDSFPDNYIVLCRTFSTGSDSDSCLDSFLNGYCTHFRDGSPSQGQISISILLYFNQGIRVQI